MGSFDKDGKNAQWPWFRGSGIRFLHCKQVRKENKFTDFKREDFVLITKAPRTLTPALLCLVVAIADGDTLTARCGQAGAYEQVKVRISAIDAPEKKQDFGQVSRQNLAALCFKQEATITPVKKDRYGRTVADVSCQGQDVSAYQVKAGLAWYYVKYGKGYEHLATMESEAKQAKRGLWAMPAAVAPWEWRSR